MENVDILMDLVTLMHVDGFFVVTTTTSWERRKFHLEYALITTITSKYL